MKKIISPLTRGTEVSHKLPLEDCWYRGQNLYLLDFSYEKWKEIFSYVCQFYLQLTRF